MFPSFLGGGNSSQTATEPRSGNSRAAPEESKTASSSFKAFKGKGTSLGSDLPKSTQKTLAGGHGGQQRPALPVRQAQNQTQSTEVDSDSLEDEEKALKKSKDEKGDYKPVNQNNQY